MTLQPGWNLPALPTSPTPPKTSGTIPIAPQPAQGLTPGWNPQPKAAPHGALAGGMLTHEQLRDLWISQGGDSHVADLMAHVAQAESSGHTGSEGSYVENGRRYYVRGLWQISTIHGQGNWFDPVANVRKAIELYNAQGMSPWEDSRNKGAGGGWGQYTGSDFARGAGETLPAHVTHPVRNGQPQARRGSALQRTRRVVAGGQQSGGLTEGWHPEATSTPSPAPTGALPALDTATDPMDTAGGGADNAPGPLGGTLSPMAHSMLIKIAGHQDLPYILLNAMQRDNPDNTGNPFSLFQLLRDPKSHVSQAWKQYLADPGQAMDEYGLGSPAQSKYMSTHFPQSAQGRFDKWIRGQPIVNAIATFIGEGANPLAMLEGGAAGGALDAGSAALKGTRVGQAVSDAAQGAARSSGLGTPLYDLGKRGGTAGTQWAQGTIASLRAPHVTANLPATKAMLATVFEGYDNSAQREIVRLSQGLPPNPQFGTVHAQLEARAKILRADIANVTAHQRRVRAVEQPNAFPSRLDTQLENSYFPMRSSYGFGPEHDLIQQIRGAPTPGGLSTQSKHLANYDAAMNAVGDDGKPLLDPDFSPAVNYSNWREQALQKVAFHDAIERAPDSLVRNITADDLTTRGGGPLPNLEHPTQEAFLGMEHPAAAPANNPVDKLLDAWATHNAQLPVSAHNIKTDELAKELGWMFNEPGDPRWVKVADNPAWVAAKKFMPSPTPQLRGKMLAPELWDFLRNDNGLQKYIEGKSFLPGQESGTFWGKFVSMARNAIISSFWWHPAVNIAGNDAAARSLYDLGGAQWEAGGYLYNAAKALAQQAGIVHPEKIFVGGAKAYSEWVSKALVHGALAEFGVGRTSALGGETARVLTEPATTWKTKLDRMMTSFGEFNRERTFGSKGEESFAVNLFKDAIQKGGMDEYTAAQVVRQTMGNYYNFDPKSPVSAFLFFAPWLKSNAKFWLNVLARKPQIPLAPAHAIRNANLQTSPEQLEGPYPTGDYTYYAGNQPITPPFVGRDVGKMAGIAGAIPQGPAAVMGAGDQLIEGRLNPFVRGALNSQSTIDAMFRPDVQGPETNFNLIVNPKAPPRVQYQQLGAYAAAHFVPVPLFGYAWQDALRRGVSKEDLAKALIGASGVGYVGQEKLDDDERAGVRRAQKAYKKAYETYEYDDHDMSALQSAWDDYMDALKDNGVLNQ